MHVLSGHGRRHYKEPQAKRCKEVDREDQAAQPYVGGENLHAAVKHTPQNEEPSQPDRTGHDWLALHQQQTRRIEDYGPFELIG